ncbi:hypothetical protein H4582DRAFT_2109565 [Lactarius indigo]|nr:hypothetical protein H4582DRAFT_2109565 [Lactarius indigo]
MATVALTTFRLQARNWLSVVAYPILFLSLQFISSLRPGSDAVPPVTPLELAIIEALKLASNILIRYRSGEGLFCKPQSRTALWGVSQDDEQPLQGLAFQDDDGSVVSSGEDVGQETAANFTVRSCLAVVFASVVWASAAYTFSSALFFFDAVTVHLAAATSTLFVLYGFYAFAGHHIGTLVLQCAVLQILGVSLAKVALSNPLTSSFTSLLVLLSVTFTSACSVFVIHNIYRSHASTLLNMLNTLLFSSGLCFHVVVCIYQAIFAPTSPLALVPEWTLRRISALIIKAQLDWTTLSVIRDHDAILERVLYSLSLALLFLVISVLNASFSLAVLAGSSVALWTSISYENESSIPTRRRRTIAGVIFAVLGLGSIIGAKRPILAPNVLPSPGPPTCQRRPLRFSPPLGSDSDSRRYKHFDDVLLIVFFSHARYDTNLDSYREVYAEYFPNILFIGPANREDAGFEHSYDVYVDTYHAAEDLSNSDEYKMAGRMAHHMLYIAMQEHPCYDGYLWAPFDTLLNVPRLQLFDQNRFWYHSPFGRYVPNPALDPSAMSNASLHAPPANISPDPADMPPWKGWGEDWWSPYVGLPAQRDRLAALTGQRDRLIGGSADTMYIPGRHKETFMSVLALFLQTNCFLEIAAPTALHLSLPHDEDILYVDHWWIWQPPFDTEFVRGKWAEGREVDTFHAFHWGEPSEEGGVWVPRPERIEDVRRLLQDSAARQGIRFPKVT